MGTFNAKAETVKRSWHIVDASDRYLGRLATEVATYLRGKHKPEYTPHVDTGDYVVVINADKIRVSGQKAHGKIYQRHTQFIGGLKETRFEDLLQRNPTKVFELAIKGMLPKNPLGREMFRKLKVYAGETHPHAAQQPQTMIKRKGGSHV